MAIPLNLQGQTHSRFLPVKKMLAKVSKLYDPCFCLGSRCMYQYSVSVVLFKTNCLGTVFKLYKIIGCHIITGWQWSRAVTVCNVVASGGCMCTCLYNVFLLVALLFVALSAHFVLLLLFYHCVIKFHELNFLCISQSASMSNFLGHIHICASLYPQYNPFRGLWPPPAIGFQSSALETSAFNWNWLSVVSCMCGSLSGGKAEWGNITIQLAKYAHRPSRKAVQPLSCEATVSLLHSQRLLALCCLQEWTRIIYPPTAATCEGWERNDTMIHFVVFHFVSFLQLSLCGSWPGALLVNMPQMPVSVSRFDDDFNLMRVLVLEFIFRHHGCYLVIWWCAHFTWALSRIPSVCRIILKHYSYKKIKMVNPIF